MNIYLNDVRQIKWSIILLHPKQIFLSPKPQLSRIEVQWQSKIVYKSLFRIQWIDLVSVRYILIIIIFIIIIIIIVIFPHIIIIISPTYLIEITILVIKIIKPIRICWGYYKKMGWLNRMKNQIRTQRSTMSMWYKNRISNQDK